MQISKEKANHLIWNLNETPRLISSNPGTPFNKSPMTAPSSVKLVGLFLFSLSTHILMHFYFFGKTITAGREKNQAIKNTKSKGRKSYKGSPVERASKRGIR